MEAKRKLMLMGEHHELYCGMRETKYPFSCKFKEGYQHIWTLQQSGYLRLHIGVGLELHCSCIIFVSRFYPYSHVHRPMWH